MELKTETQTRKLLPKTSRRIVLELGQDQELWLVLSLLRGVDDPLVLKTLLKRFFSDFPRQSVYCLGSESSAFSWVLDEPTLSSVFCVAGIGTQGEANWNLYRPMKKCPQGSVDTACCSCIRLNFSSQHPCWATSSYMKLRLQKGSPQAPEFIGRHAHVFTQTHTKKIKILLKNEVSDKIDFRLHLLTFCGVPLPPAPFKTF